MSFGLPKHAIAANTLAFAVGVSLHPSPAEFALAAAFLQFPVALLSDRFGTKTVICGLLTLLSAVLLANGASGFASAVGATIFAVALQSLAAASPAAKLPLSLGIFACGLAAAAATGITHPALPAALATVAASAAGIYAALHPPTPPRMQLRPATLRKPFQDPDAWRFGLYLAATFGLLFNAAPLAAALAAPVGLALARRFGPRPVLHASLAAILLLPLSPLIAGAGIGAGAVAALFLLPERYPRPSAALAAMLGALTTLAAPATLILGPLAAPVLALAASAVLAFEPARRHLTQPTPDSMSASLLRLAEQTGAGIAPSHETSQTKLRVESFR